MRRIFKNFQSLSQQGGYNGIKELVPIKNMGLSKTLCQTIGEILSEKMSTVNFL